MYGVFFFFVVFKGVIFEDGEWFVLFVLVFGVLFQDFYGWQDFVFDEFEECVVIGGNIGDLFGDVVFVDCCQGIVVVGDGECCVIGDGIGQGMGVFVELVEFEYFDWIVLQDGF